MDLLHQKYAIVGLCLTFAFAWVGCDEAAQNSSAPSPLETRADTVAFQLYEGLGGPEAWRALPYLRFDFTVAQGADERVVARHFWDRRTDDYRVEWGPTADSLYVALFNIQQHEEGEVFLNGGEVGSEDRPDLLNTAYSRFINDSYWTLAPVKTFDEGVRRTYLPDSSDADHEVIRLDFGKVGLTPGDRYWLYVDAANSRLSRWAFVLQGSPDAPPSYHIWEDYEELATPRGPVYVSTRKSSADGQRSILTPVYELSDEERAGLLSAPEPRLY